MSKRNSPSPARDDIEIVGLTGRTSPTFASIADAESFGKINRDIQLDPYRKSPLPDLMKDHKKVPVMDDIMPALNKKKNDGTWGGKRHRRTRKRGRGMMRMAAMRPPMFLRSTSIRRQPTKKRSTKKRRTKRRRTKKQTKRRRVRK